LKENHLELVFFRGCSGSLIRSNPAPHNRVNLTQVLCFKTQPLLIFVPSTEGVMMTGSSTRRGVSPNNLLRPSEILDLQTEFGKLGVIRMYGPGSELLQQGTPADDVYLIHEGAVKLVWVEAKGRETIVGLRWHGCFLGVPSVITAKPCPTTVITLIRSVVERIPAESFRSRLQKDADLAWKVHQIQSRELYEQINWLGELACCSARSRLANLLTRLITSGETPAAGGNARVRFPLKKKEMAELIAVTPEHLSRLLHALSKEGHVKFRNGWIIIPDPQGLAAL